jgi:hypothetical protein
LVTARSASALLVWRDSSELLAVRVARPRSHPLKAAVGLAEEAYVRVRPFMTSMIRPRMFGDLPGELNSFDAENYHHALVLFLNPPERWFRQIAMLGSPPYLALKKAVEEEDAVINSLQLPLNVERERPDLSSLKDAELAILKAMDGIGGTPRSWKKIALESCYEHDVVRRYSASLQERN